MHSGVICHIDGISILPNMVKCIISCIVTVEIAQCGIWKQTVIIFMVSHEKSRSVWGLLKAAFNTSLIHVVIFFFSFIVPCEKKIMRLLFCFVLAITHACTSCPRLPGLHFCLKLIYFCSEWNWHSLHGKFFPRNEL